MTRNRSTAKKAGTSWETDIVRALVDAGWPYAERRRLSGAADKGDIAGVPGVVIEAKNVGEIKLSAALDEALRERDNAAAVYGVAWIKRARKSAAEDGYVVMDGAQFLSLLKEAGY
jgi:hypothetical protein